MATKFKKETKKLPRANPLAFTGSLNGTLLNDAIGAAFFRKRSYLFGPSKSVHVRNISYPVTEISVAETEIFITGLLPPSHIKESFFFTI